MVVLVGTGKFLEPNDKNLASLGTQTFYGLYDANTASTTAIAGRSQLTQQTITFEDLVTFGTTQVATRWGQITQKTVSPDTYTRH